MFSDEEMLYMYCMRKGLTFSYNESKDFRSVLFSSPKSKKTFSYTYNKNRDEVMRIRVDDVAYDDVDNALQDFDDYDLLGTN